MIQNDFKLEMRSNADNERFGRSVVALFATQLNPTLEEISEIKTALSEAITNSIVHGYNGDETKSIIIRGNIKNNVLCISIEDTGIGIINIPQAMEPLYTSKPEEERSGMGFLVMESFMDNVVVKSVAGEGTKVTMIKKIGL